MEISKLFPHGSTWVRADFHLHTVADKEFENLPENVSFKKEYVKHLQEENVRVGVITNHNKFNLDEFKSLRQQARKNDIFLLPGVELSVNDGRAGVHCLLVFNYDQWVTVSHNYLKDFLDGAFLGIPNHEDENTSCKYSLNDLLKKLHEEEKQGRESFVIMAHVHDDKGFLKEVGGGRVENFAKNPLFPHFVLGFQKFRDHKDIENLEQWFPQDVAIPVFVEGSDCKNIREVGVAHTQNDEEKKVFLKLGAATFEAVRYALRAQEVRVAPEIPSSSQKLYIKEVCLNRQGKEQRIPLSKDLNTLIGMRGAGKSAVLESIRFALGQDVQAKKDAEYKDGSVKVLLGEGGEVALCLASTESDSDEYEIVRRWGEATPRVFKGEEEQVGLLPQALLDYSYYGQKDLEQMGSAFNAEKVDELFKDLLKEEDRAIETKQESVREVIQKLKKEKATISQKERVQEKIATLKKEIAEFEAYGLGNLLEEEMNFHEDETRLKTIQEQIEEVFEILREATTQGIEDIQAKLTHQPKEAESATLFKEKLYPAVQEIVCALGSLENKLNPAEKNYLLTSFLEAKKEFDALHRSKQNNFQQKKQQLNNPNIDVEKHKQNQRELRLEETKLNEIERVAHRVSALEKELDEAVTALEQAYIARYEKREQELEKLKDFMSDDIEITTFLQGDMEDFTKSLADAMRGTGLYRDPHLRKIVEHYKNPIKIWRDLEAKDNELQSILPENLYHNFKERFLEQLPEMLTHTVPDKIGFAYAGRSLEKHSIGMRTTALTNFILAQPHKKLFLIDQPEDDLDNATIAKVIVEEVKKRKADAQFIFATHNPNLLVLADSEQVIVCEATDDTYFAPTLAQSIDEPAIQEKIMAIMEGGKEAFEHRKQIYSTWKP